MDEENVYATKVWSQSNQSRTKNESFSQCYRCGNRHPTWDCKFKDAVCFKCNKKGHLAKVYRGKPKQGRYFSGEHNWKETHLVECEDATDGKEFSEYTLFNIKESSVAPIHVMAVSGVEISFEVDTGATKSIISQKMYERMWPSDKAPVQRSTEVRLRTYTGERIGIRGEIVVDVTLSNQQHGLKLLVVEGDGPSLLGRDWLNVFRLDWSGVHHLRF